MGRTTGGVEVRAASIRLSFTAAGVRYRHTLMIEGAAVLPTPANIKYANRLIAEIGQRIKAGTFSISEYFPEGATPVKRTAATPTLAIESSANETNEVPVDQTPPKKTPMRQRTKQATPVDNRRRAMGTLPLASLKLSHILTAIASRREPKPCCKGL